MVELDVYLGSRLVGRLVGEVDQVRFAYDSDRLEQGGLDIARVLPVQTEPLPSGPTRAFFDGLLPESSPREVLARDWGVDPLDTWGLLAVIGRESAGAITVLPGGELLPQRGEVDWLTEDELAEAIRRLPVAPLASDPSAPVRVSLGGVQDKLVLVYDENRWGLPHPGTPSTHIAKPDPQRDWLPHLAVNEYVCTHWMGQVGVPTASTSLITVAGRRVLVSERFDRRGSWPDVERLHQEDFAQLTGRLSIHKYERTEGPGSRIACRRSASGLRTLSRTDARSSRRCGSTRCSATPTPTQRTTPSFSVTRAGASRRPMTCSARLPTNTSTTARRCASTGATAAARPIPTT